MCGLGAGVLRAKEAGGCQTQTALSTSEVTFSRIAWGLVQTMHSASKSQLGVTLDKTWIPKAPKRRLKLMLQG